MFDASGLDTIFLLSPTTTDARLKEVAALGRGYLYYVSLKGVTGAAHIDLDDVAERVARIRAHTKLPMGVGFGIRDPETARRIATSPMRSSSAAGSCRRSKRRGRGRSECACDELHARHPGRNGSQRPKRLRLHELASEASAA